jgi:signal peptidase I
MRGTLARWGMAVVRGRSMQPTLLDGDRLLVQHGAVPRAGDLVVVRLPDGTVAVKRANPAEGVDSWRVGAIPDRDVVAVVRSRVWPWRQAPLRRPV